MVLLAITVSGRKEPASASAPAASTPQRQRRQLDSRRVVESTPRFYSTKTPVFDVNNDELCLNAPIVIRQCTTRRQITQVMSHPLTSSNSGYCAPNNCKLARVAVANDSPPVYCITRWYLHKNNELQDFLIRNSRILRNHPKSRDMCDVQTMMSEFHAHVPGKCAKYLLIHTVN